MIFYNLIVAPIEMIVDWVFTFFTTKFSAFGVIGAVCGVSLVINFLALPLYNIADSLQAKERKITKMMEPRIKRIKMAFSGDERFMMMQTYYRECNYNPIYTLRSSLSILIEIPFFIAAYHYLSHAEALKGVSFWIFKDLGASVSLFHIGSFPVNILPILMTVINLVSGAIYSKDTTLREKIQIYVLAAIFLVLLYNSPSGLVIYWILNNLFSLAKNLVMKMKNPRRVLLVIIDAILGLFACYFLFFNNGSIKKRLLLAVFVAVVILFPVLKKIFVRCLSLSKRSKTQDVSASAENRSRIKFGMTDSKAARYAELVSASINKQPLNQVQGGDSLRLAFSKSQFALFIFSALGLALLCGFYLPTSAISTSPIEFSFLGEGSDSPLTYVWTSLFTFLGLFLLWPTLIYFMFGEKVKKWESAIFFVLFLAALADVFIFKPDYGTFDVLFRLENSKCLVPNKMLSLLPLVLIILLFVVFIVLQKFRKLNIAAVVIFAVCVAQIFVGFTNISSINKKFLAYKNVRENESLEEKNKTQIEDKIEPIYHLSKTEKNVVVLFLDRAINSFFPYALQDLPELKNQLSGFVYFPNTLSFGNCTALASPSMMAGYEYTPEKINKRSDELLKKKHNEASLVAPTLFADADYEVTITDPPFPNYTWKGDLSAFEGKENIKALEISKKYSNRFLQDSGFAQKSELNIPKDVKQGIRNFSILQILLPPLRASFYGNCITTGDSFYSEYIGFISALYYLPELTDFETQKNQYIFIDNETTHNPNFLDDDFLLPSDKREFHGSYKTSDELTETHYHTFVAAFKQFGKWFDYLRENNVYDNTRIIIVSDHGRDIKLNDFSNFADSRIPAFFTPVLLFKDFNSNSELSTDETFMTNADTLFLAKKDLGLSDENPFTHKKFTQEKDAGITVYTVGGNEEWNAEKMIGKTQFTLDKTHAYHVQNNIFDEKNWIPLLDWEKEQDNGGEK